MKKALLLLLLASGAGFSPTANAQSLQLQGGTGVPGSGYTNTIRNGAGAPGFLIGNNGDFYIDTTAHVLYGPKAAGVWPTPGVSLGSGGGASVWGGITGLLVNQTDLQSAIDAKQDVLTIGDLTEAVSSVLTITGGAGAVIGGPGVTVQAKQSGASQAGYLSSADWNTFNGKQASGSYLTALTGDVTAAGPGSAAATLATVNSGSGSCGDAAHVCQVTTNAKGLVTSQSAVTVSQAPGSTGNSALTATYNAATSDTFVDCFGTVNLPASPIADETMSVYNVGSSSCTVSGGSNFIDNGTSTLASKSLPAKATIRLHWDSVNTHWRYDQGFALSLDSLTSPTGDFFVSTQHAVRFGTGTGGSFQFFGAGSPSSGTLNFSFQNGGGDDATTNKVVQWFDSGGSLLGYVDGSGNASFTSLSGSLATSWLTGTLAAARLPALTGDVTTNVGTTVTAVGPVTGTGNFVKSDSPSFTTGAVLTGTQTSTGSINGIWRFLGGFASTTSHPYPQMSLENPQDLTCAGGTDYCNQTYFRMMPGLTTSHRGYFAFWNAQTQQDDYLMGRNACNAWITYDAAQGQHRLWFESLVVPNGCGGNSGSSYINSEGTGGIWLNYHPTDTVGTGGLRVYSGGAPGSNIQWFAVNSSATSIYNAELDLWSAVAGTQYLQANGTSFFYHGTNLFFNSESDMNASGGNIQISTGATVSNLDNLISFQAKGAAKYLFGMKGGAAFRLFDSVGAAYVWSYDNTNHGWGLGRGTTTCTSTVCVADSTATTGATALLVQGGAAANDATTNVLLRVNTGGGTTEAFGVQGDGTPHLKGPGTTGSTATTMGSNCPAVTCTVPYTWIKAISADGSTVYIPAFK